MRLAVRWIAAVAVPFALAPRPAAAVSKATDLCAESADPCVVTADVVVDPNSTLDFGARALDLRHGASLSFTSGTLTIRAGSVRVEAAAAIAGSAPSGSFPTLSITTTGDIRVEATTTTNGRIDLSGSAQGGVIQLAALGAIQSDGLLLARATQAAAFGGEIDLLGVCVGGPDDGNGCVQDIPDCGDLATHGVCTGGDRSMQGVSVTTPDEGGSVTVAAPQGSISVGGTGINASGGEDGGGDIDLEAGGNVTIGAPLNVNGGGLSGDAGTVTVVANGSVSIGNSITGNAAGSLAEGGGAGADIEITAVAGGISVTAPISADSGIPDGDGGVVDLTAGTDIVQTALISAAGRGVDGTGGDVEPDAGRNLTAGAIDVSGGNGGGGSIYANANAQAIVQGQWNGDGGAIFQVLAASIVVTSKVHADASNDQQLGGGVTLQGCEVAVNAGAVVSSLGLTGENVLQASGPMTIAGTLTSAVNRLEYLDPTRLPQIATGAVVTPPPVVAPNPLLPPCGTPPPQCGNGVVEIGEGCDDGNTRACDGCSASCQVEGCGNGVVECDEQCDDGVRNGTSGDGCDASCRLVGTVRYIPSSHVAASNCFLEWAIDNPNGQLVNGFPSRNQTCIDGDPSCDADGASDGACTFRLGACLNVDDSRLPTCHPAAIKIVDLFRPAPLNPADATDVANASQLVTVLEALGMTFMTGSTVLRSGTPVAERNDCTPLVRFLVPHLAGLAATRVVSATATDTAGHRMGANRIQLTCEPNPAVCGNGVTELGESCDDGNTTPCDGCSATCHLECGNGTLECGEQCDDGAANGTPGDACTADCQLVAPALRIPGGGAPGSDCGLEWSIEMGAPAVARSGLPMAKQLCVDGDPACDFDPTPGTCRFHLWACLGCADPRLTCAAGPVSGVDVLKPTALERAQNVAARNGLLAAVGRLHGPVGPGERCTGRMDVDVPVGRAKLTFRTLAHGPGTATDRDTLQLSCVAPPAP